MPTPTVTHPTPDDADWAHVVRIRTRVFIEEQDCPPEEEWDAFDATSRHLLGWLGGTAVATARWRAVSFEGAAAAKLERFAVLPAYRGQGLGRAMVRAALEDARQNGFRTFLLHAQAHLHDFYASFGFEAIGERFEEAGIPHVKMVRRPSSPADATVHQDP